MLNRFGFRTLLMLMLLVLSLGLLAAGCGDDGDDDAADGGDTVEMTTDDAAGEEPDPAAEADPQVIEVPVADEGLAFGVTEVTASPGTIVLTSVNPQAVPHNIAIDEPTQEIGEIVQDGGTSEITVTIDEPGEYEFYCSVPGHREAGMVGKLIVQ